MQVYSETSAERLKRLSEDSVERGKKGLLFQKVRCTVASTLETIKYVELLIGGVENIDQIRIEADIREFLAQPQVVEAIKNLSNGIYNRELGEDDLEELLRGVSSLVHHEYIEKSVNRETVIGVAKVLEKGRI